MTKVKCGHARIINEQARVLHEPAGSDNVAKELMEVMARAKEGVDVTVGTLRERASALKDEVEGLRRQVRVIWMRMTYQLRASCMAGEVGRRWV
jgi:hypothetical protein